jgi:oligopeptide transport system ATP-binding protein
MTRASLLKAPAAGTERTPLLDVRDLAVEFPTSAGTAHAVRNVSFALGQGEKLGLLGESGSGKTAVARALMAILDEGARVSGSAIFEGTDLVHADERTLRGIRGSRIGMVFQDALSALNPAFSVGWQIAEALRVHHNVSRREARERAIEALARVGIPDPQRRYKDFPHQFSGGMRQRALIAAALALTPRILIADEPTTALDVTVQAQVLDLVRSICAEYDMALILVSHDLGVLGEVVDRVAVMYAGEIFETGPTSDVLKRSANPYTRGLIASRPAGGPEERLVPIPGSPPSALSEVAGCRFQPRCPMAEPICAAEHPALREVERGRRSRCHFAERLLG